MSENQKVTSTELAKIRKLRDFDLIMLISEIHDHGWLQARCTLVLMPPAGDHAEYLKKKKALAATRYVTRLPEEFYIIQPPGEPLLLVELPKEESK